MTQVSSRLEGELWAVRGTAILPDRLVPRAVIVCRGRRIEQVIEPERVAAAASVGAVPQQVIDFGDQLIAPGYVDMHVHGGRGADFMDGTVDACMTACHAHLLHGTTTIVPTTTTGTHAQIMLMVRACGDVMNRSLPDQQSVALPDIAGIHLYGPYFAADKVGCHSATGRRDPHVDEYMQYFETGLVRVATCAAELPGADAFYRAARDCGALITCGHSNASWSEMQQAFDAGMRHVDHFWCAMSSVASVRQRLGVPMQGSMAEFVLYHDSMSTEVIADGMHLSPELLRFAFKLIGPDRLCLVTDANRGLDLPPGEYRFGSSDDGSWFRSDGRVGWAPGGSLASSIMGMDHMVRTMHASIGGDLPAVIRMASLTPARRLGLDRTIGSIEAGKDADLLVLDSALHLQAVFAKGQRVSADSICEPRA